MRRSASAFVLLVVLAVTVVAAGTPAAAAASPPAVPASVAVTASPPDRAVVTWQPPATDGGSPVTGYLLTRDGTDTHNYGPWSKIVDASSRSYVVLYLRPGVIYHFTVAAINAAGTGPAVSRTQVITGPAPTAPVLTLTTSANTLTVTWTMPTVTSGPVVGYRLTRDGLDLSGHGPAVIDVSASTRSYTFTGLRPSTTYAVAVAAVTAAGAGPYATSRGSTPDAGVAPVVSAGMKAERAVVTWAAPTDPGGTVTGYVVRRDGVDDRGYGAFSATVGAATRSYTFNRLLRDTAYTFSVQPVLSAGYGTEGRVSRTTAPAWTSAGGYASDTHDNPRETALSAATVPQLARKWSVTTAGYLSSTPAVVDGTVYVADDRGFAPPTPPPGGSVTAYDATTGAVRWSRSVAAITGIPGDTGRGTPAVADGRVVFGTRPPTGSTSTSLVALDSATGALLWKRIVDTQRSARITGSTVVVGGRAYVGISSGDDGAATPQFRGSVVAIDVAGGQLVWRTYTVPVGYTGGAVWAGSPAVDPATATLYVGTGNNYTAPAGVCTRPAQTGCTAPSADDHVDSLLNIDTATGAVRWSIRTSDADVWRQACTSAPADCGPDADLGSSPNLFSAVVDGVPRTLVGVGSKSGIYWAADARTGAVVWHAVVGPGAQNGGIVFGTATDGKRIYVANANGAHKSWTLPSGQVVTAGAWTALDAATGRIVWQVADPQGAADIGFVSSANGVVYVGSTAVDGPDMYALDAATGAILWSHASGGSVVGGAAIVDGRVYWGSGYYTRTCPAAPAACAPTRQLLSFGLA